MWDEKQQELGEDKPLKQNDHACVIGDTEVWTTCGKQKVRDMVGTEGSCYCYDFEKQQFVTRDYFNVQQTRKNVDVYELELEDGRKLVCTADHKVCTANGWKPISELTQDDCVGVI